MEFISPEEIASLGLGAGSLVLQMAQFGVSWGASAASLIPDIKAGFVTTLGATYGGQNLRGAAENAASAIGQLASILSSTGGLVSTMGGYRRRAEDWLLQIALANEELEGIEKQIAAAEIRVAIAKSDLENHKLQILNSRETQEFMQQKFTNQELYDWMVSQTSELYFQSYQLAYDLAKKCERAFAFELGMDSPSMIRHGYWDNLKKGLMAGEYLHHDLKRLEVAYLDHNEREYELTKHISLSALDPQALIRLRETGTAEFRVPEALFDMDYPGHFMRRIKSVSVTIPCVTGPYTGVSATLRLLTNRFRTDADVTAGYLATGDDDPRFRTNRASTRAITTSNGQNDSGLFELNFRDDRYLPFEGAGAESDWELQLNHEFRQFDYATISDVILHIRYTARDGRDSLRQKAVEHVQQLISKAEAVGMVRLFSVRHEFPSEWAKFQSQQPAANQRHKLTLVLRPEHYPFWSRGRLNKVTGVEIYRAEQAGQSVARAPRVRTARET